MLGRCLKVPTLPGRRGFRSLSFFTRIRWPVCRRHLQTVEPFLEKGRPGWEPQSTPKLATTAARAKPARREQVTFVWDLFRAVPYSKKFWLANGTQERYAVINKPSIRSRRHRTALGERPVVADECIEGS